MALEGTLKDFSLADIFQLIGIQRKTGVLTLRSDTDVVTVSFVDGSVVSADSEKKKLEDLLGSVLVKSGRVTEGQLQQALRSQKRTLQRLGHILIHESYISHEDLAGALRLQVTQVVYRLFRWKDGDYQFKQEDTIEYDREHFIPITAESILMEGIRMIDEWPIIEKKIRSVDMVFARTRPKAPVEIRKEEIEDDGDVLGRALTGKHAAVETLSTSKVAAAEAVVVTEKEAKVYAQVNGEATVQELIDLAGLGDFETCRILYDMLARNLVREVRSEVRRAEPSAVRKKVTPFFWNTLCALIILGALYSAATMWRNPVNRIPPTYQDPLYETMLASVTRSRVKRVDEAIQVYYLQKGFYPDDLGELIKGRLIGRAALRDAWGRSLGYTSDERGYRIVVYAAGGGERDDLSIEKHPTAASAAAHRAEPAAQPLPSGPESSAGN